MWHVSCSVNPKLLPDGVLTLGTVKKGLDGGVKGKRKMFSFSLRCRIGVIRGRVKGKTMLENVNKVCDLYI